MILTRCLAGTPFVAAVVIVVVGLACSRHETPVSVETLREEQGPDQESWNPVFYISEEGVPLVHMRARYMAQYEQEDSTYMVLSGTDDGIERVRVDLFDDEGDSSAVIFADRLTYYERRRTFEARGSVVVTTKDDEFLESEHLAWSESQGRISTPGLVRYSSGDNIISGYEFEANDDLTGKRLKRIVATVRAREQ